MGYRYFDDQRLWDLTVEVFTRNGYSRSDCEDIANVLPRHLTALSKTWSY